MRCLVVGDEDRRRRYSRRWRDNRYGGGGVGVQARPVAVHGDADGARDGRDRRRTELRPVARPVQFPAPAQAEAAGHPAARAQRQRVLDHGQRPARGTGAAQRLQVHGAGAQLQRGHRLQR